MSLHVDRPDLQGLDFTRSASTPRPQLLLGCVKHLCLKLTQIDTMTAISLSVSFTASGLKLHITGHNIYPAQHPNYISSSFSFVRSWHLHRNTANTQGGLNLTVIEMISPTWLITGTSSGMGLALAQHVLKAGHNLISISRHSTAHESLSSSMLWHISHDLADPDHNTIKSKINSLLTSQSLTVDFLINNAAITTFGPLETFPQQALERLMTVNFYSPLWIIQAVLPFMRKSSNNRAIVNISSTQGLACDAAEMAYESSKHALEGMSGVLAKEVAPFEIRVLVVNLGSFRTAFALGDKAAVRVDGNVDGENPYADENHPAKQRVDMVMKLANIPDAAKGDVNKGAEVIFNAAVKTTGTEVDKALQRQRDDISKQGETAVTRIERLILGSDAMPKLTRQANALGLQLNSCDIAASLADAGPNKAS